MSCLGLFQLVRQMQRCKHAPVGTGAFNNSFQPRVPRSQDVAAEERSRRRVLAGFGCCDSDPEDANGAAAAAAQGIRRTLAEFQDCCGVEFAARRIGWGARKGTRGVLYPFAGSDEHKPGGTEMEPVSP